MFTSVFSRRVRQGCSRTPLSEGGKKICVLSFSSTFFVFLFPWLSFTDHLSLERFPFTWVGLQRASAGPIGGMRAAAGLHRTGLFTSSEGGEGFLWK